MQERERKRERKRVHMGEREREREGEREREKDRERERQSPLAPLFICFFLSSGPALCKLGLVRSVVLLEVLTQVPRTFL